jgi:lipopolysaccharide/colanic/teichoic acid biosynthesis glycosyltransferase
LFVLIAILIWIDSPGKVFYFQTRVGRYGIDFRLIKFRTMVSGADRSGGLTVGARDSRITQTGYWLRRFKLDETPQLFNVLMGDMSLVGPRPEIRKYTGFYTKAQQVVLSVRPGITDYASIAYFNENELLAASTDPEKTYIEEVMPAKIELNMRYIRSQTTAEYLKILGLTLLKIFRK